MMPYWAAMFLLGQVAEPPTNLWWEYALQSYAVFPWLYLLVGMMVVDFFTGVAASVREKKLSSKVGWAGAMKRAATLLVVGASAIAEQSARSQLPESLRNNFQVPLAPVVATFFLWSEFVSILENAKRCGVPLPDFLTKSLAQTMSRFAGTSTSETVSLNITNAKIKAELTHTETDSKIVRKADNGEDSVFT